MSSATSTTKSEAARAFATLRFHGDRLDPERITSIMSMLPAKAWHKGEVYFAGPHAGHLTGRTGTWFITTEDYVESPDINEHLDFLDRLLSHHIPGGKTRMSRLQAMMAEDGVKADVSFFWHGQAGESPPFIRDSANVMKTLHALPAKIEVDFDTD